MDAGLASVYRGQSPLLVLSCLLHEAEVVIICRSGENHCTGPAAATRQLACCGDEQSKQSRQAAVL